LDEKGVVEKDKRLGKGHAGGDKTNKGEQELYISNVFWAECDNFLSSVQCNLVNSKFKVPKKVLFLIIKNLYN
jgi:hypothetical protein